MITLEKIVIKEFRGIRDLTVEFNNQSFAVCGPNGTGKSGVVDAIEFGLTGSISRLVGTGRGELSLNKHAAHVDSRDAPEKAIVTITVMIPSIGKTATIERSVKYAATPRITPDEPDVLAALRQVANHPEFVLSRRELIKYVLATPGERAQEVSALLHLDQVEEVRAAFLKVANSASRTAKILASATGEAQASLMRALGIGSLTRSAVLAAANAKRDVLGLVALTELSETTSLKDGLVSSASSKPHSISKLQVLDDMKQLRDTLGEISGGMASSITSIQLEMGELLKDPLVVGGLDRQQFLNAGLRLIDGEACPFCDTPWNLEELRKQLGQKLEALKLAGEKRKAAEKTLEPVMGLLDRLESLLNTAISVGPKLPTPMLLETTKALRTQLRTDRRQLADVLPLSASLDAVGRLESLPKAIEPELSELERAVGLLPEPSAQVAARDWLTVAQERLEFYREARRKGRGAEVLAGSAKLISDTYAATSDRVLSHIYAAVESDFATLYASINQEDEAGFRAKLTPSVGKLGFGVDFYGRGLFPPGAYHSEGHQDGMGLCLYLALMRHLQGDNFRLAVLDDVLMSVDVGHRREVCRVLKTQFPNTQFIVTTHDRIWLRHMKTEGVIGSKAALVFRWWDVEAGPTQWDDRDVWAEIDGHLKSNDVHGAASTLRNYLEYTSAELCHALRAPVEFRGDAQYQLGELLPKAAGQLNTLLKAGRATAETWKQGEVADALGKRKEDFGKVLTASHVDQWQMNAAIHYNGWDNLSRNDFAPVVQDMKELLAHFSCPDCQSLLRVIPEREDMESVRCDCSKVSINLRRKTS